MPLVLRVPTVEIAAIKPNNDGFGQPRHRRVRCCHDIRLRNSLTGRMLLFRIVSEFGTPQTDSTSLG
jgi:hypothetical protein